MPQLRWATFTGTVQWDDGEPFQGYMILGLERPLTPAGTGVPYMTIPSLSGYLRLPDWVRIHIRDGKFYSQDRVLFNDDMEPPGSKYVAYIYTPDNTKVWGPSAEFVVNSQTHDMGTITITKPTKTMPKPMPADVGYGVALASFSPYVEVPSGTVNGTNAVFTLQRKPQVLLVVRNGVVLKEGVGYTLSDKTITFQAGYIPQPGDNLVAVYWIEVIPKIEEPQGVINGTNANFTLSGIPSVLRLVKNGLIMEEGVAYTLSGNTITYLTGYIPQAGDIHMAIWWP